MVYGNNKITLIRQWCCLEAFIIGLAGDNIVYWEDKNRTKERGKNL